MIDPSRTCLNCMAQLPEEDAVCPVCGRGPAQWANQPNQLEAGSILAGTYFVGHALGQGGFGVTYIGWDLTLDQKVAIKEYYPEGCVTREPTQHMTVLPIAGEKGAFFQRGKLKFVEEARVLARFSGDPCVVNVRRYFQENGTAYIVMDFVEGRTVKAYADACGGKLPAEETLRLMRPVAASLSRVHDAGLLHRDISPDNIMIRPDGSVQLLDFGAARQISAEGERSNTINVKHGYAPEEQYRTHGEQGPWSDVYALCATIYRLTTGITPPQAMDRLADGDTLKPPNELGAAFTEAQQAALLHGLAVRGADRIRDMRALDADLFASLSPEAEAGRMRQAHQERLARLEQEGKFLEAERERSRISDALETGTLDESYAVSEVDSSGPAQAAEPERVSRPEPAPPQERVRKRNRKKRPVQRRARRRKPNQRSKLGMAFLCLLLAALLLTLAAALTPAEEPLARPPVTDDGIKQALYGLLDAIGAGAYAREGELGAYLAQNSTEELIGELAALLNGVQYVNDGELQENIRLLAEGYGLALSDFQLDRLCSLARKYEGMDEATLRAKLESLAGTANGISDVAWFFRTAWHNVKSFYRTLWRVFTTWLEGNRAVD